MNVIIPVVVFCLRTDSVNGKNEGEYYECTQKGIINTNQWSSPKLTDHQVFICVGDKAIKEGFKRYNDWLELTPSF